MRGVVIDDLGQAWICDCPITQQGRVAIRACYQCERENCRHKADLIELLTSPIEKEPDYGRLTEKQINMHFCPRKAGRECTANRSYCQFNALCRCRRYEGRTINIRKEKLMAAYLVVIGNETKIFEAAKPQEIADAFPGKEMQCFKISHRLVKTLELVPEGEAKESIDAKVKALMDVKAQVVSRFGELSPIREFIEDAPANADAFVVSEKMEMRHVVKLAKVEAEPLPKKKKEEKVVKKEEPKAKPVEKKPETAPVKKKAPEPVKAAAKASPVKQEAPKIGLPKAKKKW